MIQIPAQAKVVRDSRITTVRVIRSLYSREIEKADGLNARVIAEMTKKKAEFAESDYCIARLESAGSTSAISPAKFYKLLKDGEITEADFLSALKVTKGACEEFLSDRQIEELSVSTGKSKPTLYTEFRPGISVKLDDNELIMKMLVEDVAAKG